MIKSPTVSILMNCYNGSKYLKHAVDSVINQTFSDWELLFWDNHSIDESAKIIGDYSDNRIRYFYAEHHTTLGEARELVRKRARGKWIAVLDVDDYWLSNNLQVKLQKEIEPDVGLIYSRYLVDRTATRRSSFVMPKRKNMQIGFVYSVLTEKNFIGLNTVLYRQTACEKVGGFRQLPYTADYDLNLRITRNWSVLAVDEVTAVYRVHGKNHSLTHRAAMIVEKEGLIKQMPKSVRRRAKSSLLVDYLLTGSLSKKEFVKYLSGTSLKRIYLVVVQRVFNRVVYELSKQRKIHDQMVKLLTSS